MRARLGEPEGGPRRAACVPRPCCRPKIHVRFLQSANFLTQNWAIQRCPAPMRVRGSSGRRWSSSRQRHFGLKPPALTSLPA